jgi:hypothetical protein
LQGCVYTEGSRYFYLTLPEKAGRPLDTEALLRHFQLKWVRYFERQGRANMTTFRTYLNYAGVAYILVDKTDP